jgi:hypothetical protein
LMTWYVCAIMNHYNLQRDRSIMFCFSLMASARAHGCGCSQRFQEGSPLPLPFKTKDMWVCNFFLFDLVT